MNPPDPTRSHQMPNPHPDTLNPADRADYDQFLARLNAADFEPLPHSELPELRRRLNAGHQTNVTSGNPGTPSSWAKLHLLAERRVPEPAATDLLVAHAKNRHNTPTT